MRTSLTDIKLTELYLDGRLSDEDALVFEARLLTDPLLKFNMFVQKKCYLLLRLYKRKKEVEAVHNRLFNDPSKAEFQQYIHQLFKK